MFCKKCGKQIKYGISFCPYCGQKVAMQVSLQQEGTEPFKAQKTEEAAVGGSPDAQAMRERPTGVSKSLILAVIIGGLLGAVAVLVFMLYSKQNQDGEEGLYQEYQRVTEDLTDDSRDGSEMPVADEGAAQEQPYEEAADAEQDAAQEEQASQYVLPESDSRYLTMTDLEGLTKEECRIARNELYARHGRRFDDGELQRYFDSCDWYEGTVAPADFDDSVLNEYEVANRDLIVMYEEEQGYR